MNCWSSGQIPIPVSFTSQTSAPPAMRAVISIRPSRVNFAELSRSRKRIWLTFARSVRIFGNGSTKYFSIVTGLFPIVSAR